VAESPVRGVVHVGADDAIRVRELAVRIGERLGRSDLLVFGALAPSPRDASRIVPSTVRLRSEVGFTPRVSLDDGLRHTIDWWRTRGRSPGTA
jgi:nucleoside-diphosphate-sugar epimerase